MNHININNLLGIIPDLLTLFFPGLVFMCIFIWIKGIKLDMSHVIIWSIFVSVIIEAICVTGHQFMLTNVDFYESSKIIIYVVIGVISPFFINAISRTNEFNKFLKLTVSKTGDGDIFNDILDYNVCVWLKIYIKGTHVMYIGKFCTREEKGKDSWISIIDYAAIDMNTSTPLFSPEDEGQKSIAVINLQNIERIEILYESGSKVWRRFHNY